MNDADFQEFADLWTEPDPGEEEAVEALVRNARRQGRLMAWADIALAVVIIGGGIGATLLQPTITTAAIVFLLIGSTTWLNLQRRKLRQMTRTLATGDRVSFIDASILIARANLRRVTLGMAMLPFLILLAIGFKISLRSGGQIGNPAEALLIWAQSTRGIITLTLMSGFVAFMSRSRFKLKRELRRLRHLRDEYESEAESDGHEQVFP